MFPVIFPIGTAAAVVAANNLSGGLTGGQSVNHSVVAPSTSIPVTSVVCQTKAQVLGSGGINTQGSTILRTNSNGTTLYYFFYFASDESVYPVLECNLNEDFFFHFKSGTLFTN